MFRHRHPANIARRDRADLSSRAADAVSSFMGSWRFLGIQTLLILSWLVLNIIGMIAHWDPYPFILLNLLFSVQAAYASPLILLAQNQQAEHDRISAEHDYETNQEALRLLQDIHAHLESKA